MTEKSYWAYLKSNIACFIDEQDWCLIGAAFAISVYAVVLLIGFFYIFTWIFEGSLLFLLFIPAWGFTWIGSNFLVFDYLNWKEANKN